MTEPTTLAGLCALLAYIQEGTDEIFADDELANIITSTRACLARHLG
ncbi:hypothetical protein [Bradyrhizobium sp.]|nr:hypothetical protein [Bradyrhizobium sp.]